MASDVTLQFRKIPSSGLDRLLGLPPRVSLELTRTATVESPLLVGPIFDEMLASPVFPEAVAFPLRNRSTEEELFNFRGTPSLERNAEEVFFHARGNVLVPAAVESADAEHEEGTFDQTFSYDVRTNFTRFDRGNILHRPQYFVSGPLAPLANTMTVAGLCRAIPLRITNLELRIDFFERRSFGALLGFAPLVVAQFSIVLAESSVSISALGRLTSTSLEGTVEGALLAAACATIASADSSDTLEAVRTLLKQNGR